MPERDFIAPLREPGVTRADLEDGGGRRRDYGPKGTCGPIVYGAVAVVAALVLLLAGCDTSDKPTEPAGEVGSGLSDTRMPPPAPAPQPEGGR